MENGPENGSSHIRRFMLAKAVGLYIADAYYAQ